MKRPIPPTEDECWAMMEACEFGQKDSFRVKPADARLCSNGNRGCKNDEGYNLLIKRSCCPSEATVVTVTLYHLPTHTTHVVFAWDNGDHFNCGAQSRPIPWDYRQLKDYTMTGWVLERGMP
jgi:hypothetical protein